MKQGKPVLPTRASSRDTEGMQKEGFIQMDMIFDTHAHYDASQFDDDREELLASMASKGVGRIVNVCASLPSIEETLALTGQYPFIYGAVGIHPDDVGELDEEKFELVRQGAMADKVVAIGEIGLDYYWDKAVHEVQKKWFRRQLELAKELDKPVIIHSRDAAADTLNEIKAAGGPDFNMVIHCFSYGTELAREYLNMGYYLGIGGVATFKNAKKIKEVVDYMPLDRLLLETDCPYLTPAPFRGKRNSSDFLSYVVTAIAELKGVTEQEVREITWKNACDFYRLPENL